MSEPLPPEPLDGAGVRPEDGEQDVPQDADTVVESEVPDADS
jgi:hypothetical protein